MSSHHDRPREAPMFGDDEVSDDPEVQIGIAISGPVRNWKGQGAFASGMIIIGLAIALNVLFDKKGMDEFLDTMPWWMQSAYERGGKLGTTGVICCLGIGVMLWGYFLQQAHSGSREDPRLAALRQGIPLSEAGGVSRDVGRAGRFHPGTSAATHVPDTGGGPMALSTMKYLNGGYTPPTPAPASPTGSGLPTPPSPPGSGGQKWGGRGGVSRTDTKSKG